jgi:hypothetical protein
VGIVCCVLCILVLFSVCCVLVWMGLFGFVIVL